MFSRKRLSAERMLELEKKLEQSSLGKFAKTEMRNAPEQEIEYMARACSMPFDQVREQIRIYNDSFPKKDELAFVHRLCEQYGQDRKTVLRRIREVKRIDRVKKHVAIRG